MARTKTGVRVIAGTAGGRRLVVPGGTTVRPMTDRMKESVFSRLGPIPLPDRTALDLFAGSGSLGLEALSRGVEHVTFVEREGRLGGTNMDQVKDLVAAAGSARVTIAGGVTTPEDIARTCGLCPTPPKMTACFRRSPRP